MSTVTVWMPAIRKALVEEHFPQKKIEIEMRVSKFSIPNRPTACPKTTCVYNENGTCDDPRNNKGNSDAACFRMNNKDLLKLLEKPE